MIATQKVILQAFSSDHLLKYIAVYFQTFQIDDLDQQPLPTWLFLFPEGTRLSPAKLEVTLLELFKRMQLKATLQFCMTSF